MSKKDTLIILGNGFDLDLGWKTSYNDFFRAKQNRIVLFIGMSFIENMVEGEYWYDLEGYIRHIAINEVVNADEKKKLNDFLLILTARLEEYFHNNPINIYTTNTKSCAFEFLKCITTNSDIVSFNYTNPFRECNLASKDIQYIHNSIDSSYSNEGRIKLGIDNGVLSENQYLNSSDISYILKSRENQIGDNLISKWKHYENIIIYGHSLGITDSDYFKPFFDSILSGTITPQSLYIVTKDSKSLEQIKENMLKYGISYPHLICSCDIINVFTNDGIMHPAFLKMLEKI